MPTLPEKSDSSRRLTELDYWESIYAEAPAAAASPAAKGKLYGTLCRIGGISSLNEIYANYQFWNVLLPRYLKPDPHARVIEIGAAPAMNLLEIHRRFGFQPYGVEYTARGAEEARKTLTNAGFSADCVFECDAFSPEFQQRHQGGFETVISMGFIEHFADVDTVVKHHVNLLAPGGTLVIRIPRLLGINYWLARMIDPSCLPLHNLTIMRRKRFRELFDGLPMKQLYCDYQGSIHMLLADKASGRKVSELALSVARKAQLIATIASFRCLAGRSMESALFSPFLLYVGRKSSLQ
jgi:SAM-dependent methyltransferase